MEINITDLFYTGQAHLYSASAVELGENAGQITWANAMAYSVKHRMLDTEDKLEAFRQLVEDTGSWTEEEIHGLSEQELNALFVQFVAGDIREACLDVQFPSWDLHKEACEDGMISSRLWKADDNQVFYGIGN